MESVRQFEDKQIIIGRNDESQLQLNDDSVSAVHAMIEERDGAYFVSDLGSKSGTFKNKLKILEEKLNSGDVIIVGNFRIQVFLGSQRTAVDLVPDENDHSEDTKTDVIFQPVAPPLVDSTPPPTPPAKEPTALPTSKPAANRATPVKEETRRSPGAAFMTPAPKAKKTGKT
jgi:predicted component of type VI protein secretion system